MSARSDDGRSGDGLNAGNASTVNANAVKTLQAIFENNECKLDVIVCKLEQCFAKFDNQQNDCSNIEQKALNPVKIIDEMKCIKSELNEVKELYSNLELFKQQMSEELSKESQVIQQDVNSFLQSINKL